MRMGLWRRATGRTGRPSATTRRRALALATSTSLTAPLLALQAIPTDVPLPEPSAIDDLARGGVTTAAGVIDGLDPLDPAPLKASIDASIELRRATPWVRAVGVEGGNVATEREVAEAAARLDVPATSATDPATTEALREGVLQRTRPAVRALGLETPGDVVEEDDVLAAAEALGVPAPDGVTPQTVQAVVVAGDEVVASHLEQTVTPYAEALGLDIGQRPDPADARAVAAELGLELTDVPDEAEAAALHGAWLQTLRPVLDEVGLGYGQRVDPVDLVALGRVLKVDVGEGRTAADARNLAPVLAARAEQPPVVGSIEGVPLHLPSRDVLLAGWHQAAGPTALPMDRGSEEVAVDLPSRGRPFHPHSALDVAVTPGTEALSPVTGTVVEVSPYVLYGKHPDTRIVIQPDGAPHLGVGVLHVTGPLVTVGQEVTVGTPLAAEATQFPFSSQIDRFAGRAPHIHIEVKAIP